MESTFHKLCKYYLNDEEEKKEFIQNSNPSIQKKALKYSTQLKKKVEKLGFNTTFESFCNMLENYIKIKDDLDDNAKKSYLKLLISLSKVYEINLREELEKYVSYKKNNKFKDKQRTVFYRLCHYNLYQKNDQKELDEIKKLLSPWFKNFDEFQKKSLAFVEEIKVNSEKLGYTINDELFNNMLNDYFQKKFFLKYDDKAKYLKVLLYLSEIYNLDLRQIIIETKTSISEDDLPKIKNKIDNKEKVENTKIVNKESLIDNNINEKNLIELTNILDDATLLSKMFTERYENGYFDIKAIILLTDKIIIKRKTHDYLKTQADLTHKLYNLFIEKFDNSLNELNSFYTNLIQDDELTRLKSLTREEIYEIIKHIKKPEPVNYIIRKFKLTNNLYTFIKESLNNTDLLLENSERLNNPLFNINKEKNDITIYLNGPELETNLIINDYIKKCVENNINYELELSKNNEEYFENTELYANKNDLLTKLSILNKIAIKHSDWTKLFGAPIKISTQINNSFYGVSTRFIMDDEKNETNYIDLFNDICEASYYRVLAKIVIAKINDENASKMIEDFINFQNMLFNKDKLYNPIFATYNEIEFSVIKDLINQYIPLVNELLHLYIEQSNKDIIINEFKKSLQYFFNLIQRNNKPLSNISLTEDLYSFIKSNYSQE